MHLSFIHTIDGQNFALCIVSDGGSHSAAGRSQSHFHLHAGAAVVFFDQPAIVNQAEIDNVDWNLGVVALPKLVPNIFFGNFAVCLCGLFFHGGFRLLQPERVQILFGDARQPVWCRDRITSAKRLCDHALGTFYECKFTAAWNLNPFTVAAQAKLRVLLHL